MLCVDGPAGKYIYVAIHVPKLNHPVRTKKTLFESSKYIQLNLFGQPPL